MDWSKFKDLTINIGRESGTNRLYAYFIFNGHLKGVRIGNPGYVPNSVSRALPSEDKAHISLHVSENGNLNLTNLKSENITFVNGSQIVSKQISEKDLVELGSDKFRLEILSILESISNVLENQINSNPNSKKEIKTYNISHLETIWNEFKNGQKEIKEKQKKINLIRSGCGIFTMCAMPTIFFLGPIGYVLTGIGVIGNLYSFVGMKKSDPQEEMEELTDNFQERYVCPNPDCRRFLGNYKYSMMKNQYKMECPYCKSKFEEK